MSETLYRKYRPKNFSEIIGQAHIVRTLSNAVRHERIAQAYLFCGPRGTGKTSIARILAKTINCKDLKEAISCEKCQSCQFINDGKSLDIIEIDAASNTGVDNIRELRETVALPPTSLKYKVYIIDEVHMLSTGAFNALLKTLEEPPSHVIFILATTEIHKVPDTIISRCQRFDFARLPIENIIEKLSLIASKEKIKIEKDALEMIAIAAEGGMRDAESLMAQIIALEDKNITSKEVQEILGTADRQFSHDIAANMIKEETGTAIEKINTLLYDGYDLQVFNKSLINYFRQLMLLAIDEKLSQYFTFELTKDQVKKMADLAKQADLKKIINIINLLLEAQSKISSSVLPQLPLEIAIIKATGRFPTESIRYKESDIDQKKETKKNETKATEAGQKKEVREELPEVTEERHENADSKNITMDDIRANWNRLLIDVRPFNHSLNALLSNCQPSELKGRELAIGTPYDFYKEKLNEAANRLTIEQVFSKILESKIMIHAVIDKNLAQKPQEIEPEKKSQQDDLLSSAMEIMGGKVVEE